MSEPLFPLSVYAAVTAALGEGYTLAEALEHQGLSEDEWDAGEEEWVDRLDDSAESDLALFDELERELAAQRARFARKIAPLDEDLGAYLVFQRHFSTAERPATWLAQQGLFLGDWVRLQELWADRLSKDPEVRARTGVLLASAEAAPLPELQLEPRKRPPPVRPRAPAPIAIEVEGVEVQSEPLEWGLSLLRPDGPPRRAPARGPAPAPSPSSPSPVVREPAPAAPPAASAALPTFMRGAAPKADPPPAAPVGAPTHNSYPEFPKERPTHSEATTMAGVLPIAAVTPFKPGAASPGLAAGRGEEGETLDDDPDGDEPSTIIGASLIPEEHALPFRPAAPAAPPSAPRVGQPPTAAPRREAPKSDEAAHATMEAQASPMARSALPFRPPAQAATPPAPARPALPAQSPAKTPPAPQRPPTLAARPPAPQAAGAVPGAASPAPGAQLTLDQYAAMCAALAVFPERADAIFARHGLSDPRRRAAADAQWKAHLARYPSERAEWERRYWQWETSWRRAGWR